MAGPFVRTGPVVEPPAPVFPRPQMPLDRVTYLSARRAKPRRPAPHEQQSESRQPAHLAARMGDKVAHTKAWAGLGWGALVGALIGVAFGALLIVATGGLGAIAVGAAIAAVAGVVGGAAGGALAGAAIGETFEGDKCSEIEGGPGGRESPGCSPDTMIETKWVARAGLDQTTHDHAILCQGSKTVIVNNKPLARLTDKVKCSGKIQETCKKTIIGGPTETVVQPDPAIPSWLTTTLKWTGLAAGVVGAVAMAPAVGVGATVLGFAGSMIGGELGGRYGAEFGAWVGRKMGNEERGAAIGAAAGGFLGSFAGGMAGTRMGQVGRTPAAPPSSRIGQAISKADQFVSNTRAGRYMVGKSAKADTWLANSRFGKAMNAKAMTQGSRMQTAATKFDRWFANTRLGKAVLKGNPNRPWEKEEATTANQGDIQANCKTCEKPPPQEHGGEPNATPKETAPVEQQTVNEAPPPAAEPTPPAPPKPVSEIEVNPQLSINEAVRGADRATLRAALKDPEVAASLAKQGGTTPRRVQRDAAILLSRDAAGPLKPGQIRTREAFEYEAGLLDHAIEPLPEVYRLDARTPQQIAETGFTPNPNKEPATLWEHTATGVSGGGNYVSTSTQSANRGTLLNPDFFEGTPIRGTNPLEIKQGGSVRQTPEDYEYVRYEYRIKDTEGVVLRNAAYAEEQEAVIRSADPSQIEYREIRIRQRYQERVDVDEDGASYWYDLTPIKKIQDSDVSLGEWQPLPAKGGSTGAAKPEANASRLTTQSGGETGNARPTAVATDEAAPGANPTSCKTCGDQNPAPQGGGGATAPKDATVAIEAPVGSNESAIEPPAKPAATQTPNTAPARNVKGFASEEQAQLHFQKHGKEFGNITQEEYIARARELLSSEVGDDIKGYTAEDGWVYRYNEKTNEFAKATADGNIWTFYKPKRGAAEWEYQYNVRRLKGVGKPQKQEPTATEPAPQENVRSNAEETPGNPPARARNEEQKGAALESEGEGTNAGATENIQRESRSTAKSAEEASPCKTCAPEKEIAKNTLFTKAKELEGELFGPNGPQPSDVKQGALGDCYLLATLQAIAKKNPQIIRNMVRANPDGTYTVTFRTPEHFEMMPDGSSVRVPAKTKEVTVSGKVPHARIIGGEVYGSSKAGNWPQIIEKAYAQEFGGDKGYKGIGDGGYPSDVMDNIVGMGEGRYRRIQDNPWTAKRDFARIKGEFDNGAAMVAQSRSAKWYELGRKMQLSGPVPDHAWAVTDMYYDPQTGQPMVELYNPHNVGGKYGSSFTLPYEQFQKDFNGMYYSPAGP